ncbi:helix-turn-helix domain-containing protein [Capnocytophaga sp. oral taxon 902]|uniref:Helix-turn-helix domain-containing protein n=1 Tax=Capnocytophaga ochracea TaxID=1018 RepID=A0AA46W785_CAPOC|nr:helix-turn-helix domain-containing protein [Capnocytophaga ochracea]QLF49661.1 helix-turn-helix domain-containing protein [Capnocytophaga sp. oral taxon 902]UZD40552.1 helix-turn-helix domain-containing protein [Capnocytophaga ochracea]
MEEYILTLVNQTNRNIFLTGKAGTGKTTLLHKIINTCYKNTVVVAPTGIAALNASGVTIHSMFQLPFASFLPTLSNPPIVNEFLRFENRFSLRKHFQMHKNKQQVIRNMELLIVDEVSMLRADVLDAMDYMLQFIRKDKRPFGGVQVLFIGDLLQLPPVVKQEEWEVLKHYYKGMYFFQSEVITQNPLLYVELETIYRQTDKLFISILNHLRENQLTSEDIKQLEKYVQPDFPKKHLKDYITLTTHNAKADAMNQREMSNLSSPLFSYQADIVDDFPEYLYPIEKVIQLKEGARVMFIKNDISGEHLFFNGKMGTVVSLSEGEITVKLDGGRVINVERYEWENVRYKLNETTKDIEEERLGSFTQYPLRLAWAITIHKSQGLTFEKAILDLASVFASGQAYVAFSRLRSLDGLVLLSSVSANGINNNGEVIGYAENKASEKEVQTACYTGKTEFLQENILNTFQWNTLLEEWVLHRNSYSGEIGNKNLYKDWASQQLVRVQELVTVSEKFIKQLKTLFNNATDVQHIFERVAKGITYFTPLLEQLWYEVLLVEGKIANQKKVKQFFTELKELDNSLSETLKKLFRLEQMIQLAQSDQPFDKEKIHSAKLETLYTELTGKINNILKNEKLFISEYPLSKDDKPKKEKRSTYDITLQLWKEGKTVAEIAKERTLSQATIYSHIAKCIEQDKIAITEVLSEETINELNTIFKENEELTTLKSLYEKTEERYSWDELRLFRAYLLKEAKKT